MLNRTSIALVLMAVAASGCTRSSNALSGVSTQSPPQALPSVPSGNVRSAQLDPLSQPNELQQPQTPDPALVNPIEQTPVPDPNAGTQVAAVAPVSQKPLSHEPLAGAWNVASDSSGCRAILSFTQWSGGYRATTLRCNSPELSTVTAWDIKSNRVVLVDNNGSQVASLSQVGTERYSGQTKNGSPISFSR